MHTDTQASQQGNTTHLPLSSQVACALLIIRSKPHHLSIEEHLRYLRSAIVGQRPHTSLKSTDFDSGLYWKSAHQASERERLALVDKVAKLEEELATFRGESVLGPLDVEGPMGTREREQPCGQEQLSKVVNDSTGNSANDKANTSHSTIFTGGHADYRQNLLRGIFLLKHNLRLQTPDYARLSAAIRTVTTTLCHGLQPKQPEDAAQRTLTEAGTDDRLEDIIEDTYPLVLRGLSLLQHGSGDESQLAISAVPDIVRLFRVILSRLHSSAQDVVAQRKETPDTPDTPVQSSQERLGGDENIWVDEFKECKSPSKMLTRMVLRLDLSQNAHCGALEGFLCALLDHIGSLLSLLVFSNIDHESRSDIGILPPKGLLSTPHSNLEVAIECAKIEGPYVISVLREATDFLKKNIKVMSERSLLLFTTQKMADDKGLRHATEEKLQKTLLRGVFGDDDATFSGGLCRHDHLIEPDIESLMKEMSPDTNTSEWFIGQLWEHLGWDILSGHNTRC